jgi:predicted metal-dependent phosphoesterase TrpH
MKIISDLHMHSTYSDGFWTVQEIFQEAKKRGLKQISITDHNVINAIEEAKKISKNENIEFIPGVELDVKTKINENIIHNHILAYRNF